MRKFAFLSLSIVMATGAWVAGCGSPELRKSALGESCTRTDDCTEGLGCIANLCMPSGTVDADGGVTPPTAPLGAEGESCTRRADCQSGLSCVQQKCVMDPTSVPGQNAGHRGETCVAASDCAAGLTCVNIISNSGFSTIQFGICDIPSFGLMPTGKVCGGDCTQATDCCELPPNTTISGMPYKSCADLLATLLGGDAAASCPATPDAAHDAPCFYYKTYCDCAADTWACTNNQCTYTAACKKDGNVWQGCPTVTRAGSMTGTATCNLNVDGGKCQPTAATTACAAAADCTMKPIVDDPSYTCKAGVCTCYQSQCYRKCGSDLDCAQHYTCDTTSQVCVPAPVCSTDAECVANLSYVGAKCQSGACVKPCDTDLQCSGTGTVSGGGGQYLGRVCGPEHTCQPVGCSSDSQCAGPGGVRTFCVTPKPAPTPPVRSAITDGKH